MASNAPDENQTSGADLASLASVAGLSGELDSPDADVRVESPASRSQEPPDREERRRRDGRSDLADGARHFDPQRYRLALSALSQGSVVQGRDEAVSSCKPPVERILGLSAGQTMGMTSVDSRWRRSLRTALRFRVRSVSSDRADGQAGEGRRAFLGDEWRAGERVARAFVGMCRPARPQHHRDRV